MSKIAFFLVTLLAAIPAGLVAFFLVMAFLNHFSTLPLIMQGVAGLTLLLCVAIVLLPVVVLIKTPKQPKFAAAGAASGVAAHDMEMTSGEVEVFEDAEVGTESFEAGEGFEEEDGGFGESEDFVSENDDVFVEGADDEFEDFFDDDEKKK